MRYKVQTPFSALQADEDGGQRLITVEVGTVVVVVGEEQPSGLIDILYGSQLVAAFLHDIRHRCKVMSSGVAV